MNHLIWSFLPSGHIDYLNWPSLVVFSMNIFCNWLLIWRFLGPNQINQLKSPPNINCFTVCASLWCYVHIYYYWLPTTCKIFSGRYCFGHLLFYHKGNKFSEGIALHCICFLLFFLCLCALYL